MNSQQQNLSVVVSGGGCKTFWSLGVLERFRPILPPVTEFAGVSAGSAMAAAFASGRTRETIEHFCARTAANRANFYPLNLLTGQPSFPQEAIYRDTVLHALSNGGFEALRLAPPLRILLAYFAEGANPLATIFWAVRAYRERKRRLVIHGPTSPQYGLRTQVVTAQDCETPDILCNVIMASSSTPPLTAIQTIDGRRYADGALVDHAPVRALTTPARRGKVLVLSTMTIPRQALPSIDRRLYLAPSRDVSIQIWDYANPDKVVETFERGYEEAEQFLTPLESFLDDLR